MCSVFSGHDFSSIHRRCTCVTIFYKLTKNRVRRKPSTFSSQWRGCIHTIQCPDFTWSPWSSHGRYNVSSIIIISYDGVNAFVRFGCLFLRVSSIFSCILCSFVQATFLATCSRHSFPDALLAYPQSGSRPTQTSAVRDTPSYSVRLSPPPPPPPCVCVRPFRLRIPCVCVCA